MFDHILNVVKGPTPMHRLDYHGAPDPATTIYEGMVMYLNDHGQLVAGCATGGLYNRPMPMFAIQGINDFDANSDVGNISGGVMSGIVATGGFEIETTEFVAGTYNWNDLLTAATGANLGKVMRCTGSPYHDEPVVGCVSKRTFSNADGKSVLSFWTMFLPSSSGSTPPAESSSSSSSQSSSSSSSSSSSDSSSSESSST
jgi:hypothetical protein